MPDELTLLEALPNCQQVAKVLEALGLSKSTLYKYAGELAIKPQTHRGKAWLAELEGPTAGAKSPPIEKPCRGQKSPTPPPSGPPPHRPAGRWSLRS